MGECLIANTLRPEVATRQTQRHQVSHGVARQVCNLHRLGAVLQRRQREADSGCLVYSVGCGDKWHMEDGLLGLFGPVCEIHDFDLFDYEA